MDMKGDISGLAMSGEKTEKITARLESLGNPDWKGSGFPTEFYTLTNMGGVNLRSSVSEFGPILLSRLMELNETQSSVVSMVFHICDTQGLLLSDLNDLKKVLQYFSQEGHEEIEKEYGAIAPATVSVIMRKIIELESQGADIFFGEPSFDTHDFLMVDENGYGRVNIIRLMDMMMKPKLFSTFMLSLLSEIYQTFPEEGDLEKPKLVLIIDEAHLLFEDAPKVLLDHLEMIIKLIRSKGVGIIFCTQNPIDIPSAILSQLGLKVQHALRAFTAKDREAIEKASENFPESTYYTVASELTELGVGEAFITALDEKGIPTPLVRTMIYPPESRMDTLTDGEFSDLTSISPLVAKYRTTIDPESAREILEKRIAQKITETQTLEQNSTPTLTETIGNTLLKTAVKSIGTELARNAGKSLGGRTGGTIGAQIARGVLGAIFGGR